MHDTLIRHLQLAGCGPDDIAAALPGLLAQLRAGYEVILWDKHPLRIIPQGHWQTRKLPYERYHRFQMDESATGEETYLICYVETEPEWIPA